MGVSGGSEDIGERGDSTQETWKRVLGECGLRGVVGTFETWGSSLIDIFVKEIGVGTGFEVGRFFSYSGFSSSSIDWSLPFRKSLSSRTANSDYFC